MRIAVVHTVGAPCRCAQSVAEGIYALGHQVLFADSAGIEMRVQEIAETCDLVIDHTDTFCGTGMLRPFVRGLLEAHGARIVGSDAAACLRADNKKTAKKYLADAGVPVPPWISVTSGETPIPAWLKRPVVLKPACEHMSRGLHIVQTDEEISRGLTFLLDKFKQPILVETFIQGRELAVSILEDENGPYALPPLEWLAQPGDGTVLTEAFKLTYVSWERQDTQPAQLAAAVADELKHLCLLAFRALGLRDYARFDIRLSPGGQFYFLEANTTPSLEPQEALALSARWAGIDYASLVKKMLAAALRRFGRKLTLQEERMQCKLPAGHVGIAIPPGVHHPPASTLQLANMLDVRNGESVLDLGCGAGLLSVAAAKAGAGLVIATDLDPRALAATGENARANGVAEKIKLCAGSWYEALAVGAGDPAGSFDLIVATPPQTPGPYAFGPRYGGPDGTRHLETVIKGAPLFLKPECGRLWLLVISLADAARVLRLLEERFRKVSIVHESERFFTEDEYEEIETGLMQHLLSMRRAGRSDFREAEGGGFVFKNIFICAEGMKTA